MEDREFSGGALRHPSFKGLRTDKAFDEVNPARTSLSLCNSTIEEGSLWTIGGCAGARFRSLSVSGCG
nr:hypothetical protein [Rhodococcus erythropolis]